MFYTAGFFHFLKKLFTKKGWAAVATARLRLGYHVTGTYVAYNNRATTAVNILFKSTVNTSASSSVTHNLQNMPGRLRRYSFQTQQDPSADSIESPTGRLRLMGRIKKHRVSYPNPTYPMLNAYVQYNGLLETRFVFCQISTRVTCLRDSNPNL